MRPSFGETRSPAVSKDAALDSTSNDVVPSFFEDSGLDSVENGMVPAAVEDVVTLSSANNKPTDNTIAVIFQSLETGLLCETRYGEFLCDNTNPTQTDFNLHALGDEMVAIYSTNVHMYCGVQAPAMSIVCDQAFVCDTCKFNIYGESQGAISLSVSQTNTSGFCHEMGGLIVCTSEQWAASHFYVRIVAFFFGGWQSSVYLRHIGTGRFCTEFYGAISCNTADIGDTAPLTLYAVGERMFFLSTGDAVCYVADDGPSVRCTQGDTADPVFGEGSEVCGPDVDPQKMFRLTAAGQSEAVISWGVDGSHCGVTFSESDTTLSCAKELPTIFDVLVHGGPVAHPLLDADEVHFVGEDEVGEDEGEEEEEEESHGDGIVNLVINCKKDVERLAQFSSRMKRAGLEFEVFPCFVPDNENIRAAINRSLVSPDILNNMNNRGWVGCGLAHITAMEYVALNNISKANIFEDDEVVPRDYAEMRASVLSALPEGYELIKLNPLRPNGETIGSHTHPRILRMFNRNRLDNVWNSNYLLTNSGAKKVLHNLRHFKGTEQIDWYLSEMITAARGTPWEVASYTIDGKDKLSKHCEVSSVKDQIALDMAHSAKETLNLGSPWHER